MAGTKCFNAGTSQREVPVQLLSSIKEPSCARRKAPVVPGTCELAKVVYTKKYETKGRAEAARAGIIANADAVR